MVLLIHGDITHGEEVIIMEEKFHPQKAYEKVEMVRHNSDKLDIWMASRKNELGGKTYCFVLMVDGKPIAEILKEPNDLMPEFDFTEQLKPVFDSAREIDSRRSPEEFDAMNSEVTKVINDGLDKFESDNSHIMGITSSNATNDIRAYH
jgi:hypothetical protein